MWRGGINRNGVGAKDRSPDKSRGPIILQAERDWYRLAFKVNVEKETRLFFMILKAVGTGD
jgi:hypothetical protein